MKRRIYPILCFLFLSLSVMGQGELLPQEKYLKSEVKQTRFDEQKWKSVIKGIDYSGDFSEVDIDVDEDDEEGVADEGNANEFDRKYTSSTSSDSLDFWSGFFKFLFIAMVIALVAFLAYRLIGEGLGRPKNRKFTPSSVAVSLEEIEENIHDHDFRYYIHQAIQEKNYALAIRLYYLAILKELSLKKSIKWKREKTNREYLREMRSNESYDSFRQVTQIFERVWYGNGQLAENDFQQLKPYFERLVEKVQVASPPKAQADL